MMPSSTMILESLPGIDLLQQIALLQNALQASSDVMRNIATHCTKLVSSISIPGPEISSILNLSLEHRVLNGQALEITNDLLNRLIPIKNNVDEDMASEGVAP